MEKTLFFIKSDAYHKNAEIIADIKSKFTLNELYPITFNESILKELYPRDINRPYFPALLEYMVESISDIGFIEGSGCLKRFYEYAGIHLDPKECSPGTIRYRYGKGLDKTHGSLWIIKNAIHRCKSDEEFMTYLNIFKKHGIIPI